ncbi:MAG: hypothetical protein ABGY95_11785 [Rubritalea sp.]|mgnify:CR=1
MLSPESTTSLHAKLTAGELTPVDIIDSIEASINKKEESIKG